MMDLNPWKEYMSALSEEKFFYMMRLYFGDIKTPYNKLRLIEQLASFARNGQNLQNLISLLDENDIKILTIISLMPSVTAENFCSFLEDDMSHGEVLVRLENLQTRLLIYTEKVSYQNKVSYRITPLVEEEIKPYLDPESILPGAEPDHISLDSGFTLTPNFLAAFISYLNINGCSLKADGSFKKTDISNLNLVFGERIECLQLLVKAFINLGLVIEGEKKLSVDEKRFADFASMDEAGQYITLAVSSVMRLSRDGLKKQSQLLADTLASVPEWGCTRKTFLRLAQIIAGRPSSVSSVKTVSRFSEMLNQARNPGGDSGNISDAYSLMDAAFSAIVEFGLLVRYGENESDGTIYKPGFCKDNGGTFVGGTPKVLNINASSSVTLLPGLPLKALLPFTTFMQAINCSTVTEFEISRKSVSCAFDRGLNLDRIKELLSAYATFDLPQNLLFNLEEWYSAYSSAVLYRGYVLKVSKDNVSLVENNPQVAGFVQEKLADGVYLLNLPADTEASVFLKSSGLDFMGSVKTVKTDSGFSSYPRISEGNKINLSNGTGEYKKIAKETSAEVVRKLLHLLNESSLDEHQKESLQSRIFNHLIISESQISSSSVRSEILVADGIDFSGKVHLIDAAIKSNDNLELTLVQTDGSGQQFSKLIHPVKLIKSEGEAILKCEYVPSGELGSFSVSRIVQVKRIRNEIK